MTAEQWNAATHPTPMLEFLQGKTSGRKFGLFAVACCRLIWPLLKDDRTRRLVWAIEQEVDGAAGPESRAAFEAAGEVRADEMDYYNVEAGAEHLLLRALLAPSGSGMAVSAAVWAARVQVDALEGAGQPLAQCGVLRDIIGRLPFRPVTFDPSWSTSTVVAIATQMYDRRDFAPMPILADAIQEAGCENEDILNHLRGPGPHVRGCWVIDAIFGKE